MDFEDTREDRIFIITKRKLSGFTLIELLVIIGILGVITVGVIATINPFGQFQKANNALRKEHLQQMASALERYYVTHGMFPSTGGRWCSEQGTYNCGPDFIPGLVASGEMKKLPRDPSTGKTQRPCNSASVTMYLYRSNGIDYKLLAYCTPEGNVYSSSDPFYDPRRPTTAWQVSSAGGINW